MTNVSRSANPNCDECMGEGICDYGNYAFSSDGVQTLPCQKCFPNSSWQDFNDDDREDDT